MIQEILECHESESHNIQHVFYQNSDNHTLFISFAGMIDKYVSVTWFYNQMDVLGNFLFLKNDPDYDSYMRSDYEELIQDYIDRLKIEKIIMYGPSMGGIGAIHYGLKFKADVIIAIDPNPINFNYHELIESIKQFEPVSASQPSSNSSSEPSSSFEFKHKFYINYTFEDDTFETKPEWTEAIIRELEKKNMVLTLQPYCSNKHLEFIPSKDYLFSIIHLYLLLKVNNYNNVHEWI